jgi:gelsolin-related protein of 125 kDa
MLNENYPEIKEVNVFPKYGPITTVNPPIRVAIKNALQSIENIRRCIAAGALVEEVLDGENLVLDFTNYDADNRSGQPVKPVEVKEEVVVEDKVEEAAPVVEEPKVEEEATKEEETEEGAEEENTEEVGEVVEEESSEEDEDAEESTEDNNSNGNNNNYNNKHNKKKNR